MKKISSLLIILFILVGCSKDEGISIERPVTSYESTANCSEGKCAFNYTGGFDTILSFATYGESDDLASSQFETISTMFKNYSDLFDIYNNYEFNNLKTVNDNAGIQPVSVDKDTMEMLVLSKDIYDLSNGEFDITQGAVFKIWHNYREDGLEKNGQDELGDVPGLDELQQASACTGWDYVQLDQENNTVYLTDSCASLDVGGIAKGFATEKIRSLMESETENGLIINAGGNTGLVNHKPDGNNWTVGIANPNNSRTSIVAVSLGDNYSVVTSGDYERYYKASDGNTYAHIIDPQTLFPPTYWRSVTVICQNGAIADGMSTALFTMDYQDGLAFIDRVKQAYSDLDINVIWISEENSYDNEHTMQADNMVITYTSGLEDKIIALN